MSGRSRLHEHEREALHEEFYNDSRWKRYGADVNLSTLYKEAADRLTAARQAANDPRPVLPITIENARATFASQESRYGELFPRSLPSNATIVYRFAKVIRLLCLSSWE